MDRVLIIISSCVIGLLFASSALHKLRDYREFNGTLASYDLFPSAVVPFIATCIVFAEVLIVATILVPSTASIGAWLAIGLLLLYAMGMGINIARGRVNMNCGCSWGGRAQRIRPILILRNIALALVAAILFIPAVQRSLGWLDWISIAMTVAAVACLYLAAETLAVNKESAS
jgi:hypothetical protein